MLEVIPPTLWRWGRPLIFGAGLISLIGCRPFTPRHEVLQVASQGGTAESSPLLNQALRQYQSGHLELAASKYEQALAVDPGLGTAHNNLGLVRYYQRRLVPAAEHFDRAIQLLPGDPRPINNLGLTLEAGGRVMEAVDLYAEASELEPDNPLYLGNWLRARVRLGEHSEELIAQLEQLAFTETRPDWLSWTDEQLAVHRNPMLDRGPAPTSQLNSKARARARASASEVEADGSLSPQPPIAVPALPDQSQMQLIPSDRPEMQGDDGHLESLPVPAPDSVWDRIHELQ
jgi:hypothetical protein